VSADGYGPLNGQLKGADLGIVAFEVLEARTLTGQSSGSLPEITIRVLDPEHALERRPRLFTEAPEPRSSSEPYDIR
jgi:hypothetical protein